MGFSIYDPGPTDEQTLNELTHQLNDIENIENRELERLRQYLFRNVRDFDGKIARFTSLKTRSQKLLGKIHVEIAKRMTPSTQ